MSDDSLHEAVHTWLLARNVVLAFLVEFDLSPSYLTQDQLEHAAAALLARLAAHDPPILLGRVEEFQMEEVTRLNGIIAGLSARLQAAERRRAGG